MLKIKENSFSLRALRTAWTFFLVNVAWVLFRADSLSMVMDILGSFRQLRLWQIFDGTLYLLGLDRANVHLLVLGLLAVIIVDLLNERGCFLSQKIAGERLWIRWPIYLGGILLILLCGMWGAGYNAASFIYYQF